MFPRFYLINCINFLSLVFMLIIVYNSSFKLLKKISILIFLLLKSRLLRNFTLCIKALTCYSCSFYSFILILVTKLHLRFFQIQSRRNILRNQSWTKYLKTFSRLNTISLHRKWKGTILSSTESKCTNFLMSCQTN